MEKARERKKEREIKKCFNDVASIYESRNKRGLFQKNFSENVYCFMVHLSGWQNVLVQTQSVNIPKVIANNRPKI